MDICFEGIGRVVATFRVKDGEDVQTGMAVTLTGNGEVGLNSENKTLCGVAVGAVRGDAVAVQIGGVVKVGCSGDGVPQVGWQELVCDGKGKVKTAETGGTKFLVLSLDEDGKSAVVRL